MVGYCEAIMAHSGMSTHLYHKIPSLQECLPFLHARKNGVLVMGVK